MLPTTGIPIIDWALSALDTLGYLIVFGATVFENLFVVGSLTPGETVVIAAAFVASMGRLYLPLVWLSSVLGTLTGSNISYGFGRKLGRDALVVLTARAENSRAGRVFGISAASVEKSEQYFIDHGAKTVLISRFAVGLKNFVPVIAGASRMSLFWFEVYTLLGAVIYTSLMCAIGWFLGANFDIAMRIAGSLGWIGLLVVALLVVGVLWLRRNRREDEAARVEEAQLEAQSSELADEAQTADSDASGDADAGTDSGADVGADSGAVVGTDTGADADADAGDPPSTSGAGDR